MAVLPPTQINWQSPNTRINTADSSLPFSADPLKFGSYRQQKYFPPVNHGQPPPAAGLFADAFGRSLTCPLISLPTQQPHQFP